MPAQIEARGPIEDRDGFSIREDHTTFTILKDSRVLAEPDDGEKFYVHPEDYSAGIIEEFERRLRLQKPQKLADEVGEISDVQARRLRFGRGFSVDQVFEEICEPAIREQAEQGQKSLQLRLVLTEGDIGPPPQTTIMSSAGL